MRLILVLLALTITSCSSIGPGTIPRDRFNYSDAIANSWKQEMLLNLVKIRYGDSLVFLEVSSVISQYSLESEISASAGFSNGLLGDRSSIGGKGKLIDRPTVTYVPLTGAKFTQSILRPISVKAVLDLIESGWPADVILRITVESCNGYRNRSGAAMIAYLGDPEFFEICKLFRSIQQSGHIDIRTTGEDDSIGAMIFPEMNTTAIGDERARLRSLLNIEPTTTSINVIQGSVQQDQHELALRTRSMIMILADMAARVEVPQQDIIENRATDPFGPLRFLEDTPALVSAIHWSEHEPDDAFVAVKYRDKWFYIDDKDINSKRAFTLLTVLLSLADSNKTNATPVITVPTG